MVTYTPHLPVVIIEINGPPYPHYLAEFITDGSNFFLNTTDDVQTFSKDWANLASDDQSGRSDDANDDAAALAGSAISIDGFAPDSAYPGCHAQYRLPYPSAPTPNATSTSTSTSTSTCASTPTSLCQRPVLLPLD